MPILNSKVSNIKSEHSVRLYTNHANLYRHLALKETLNMGRRLRSDKSRVPDRNKTSDKIAARRRSQYTQGRRGDRIEIYSQFSPDVVFDKTITRR